MTNLAHPAVILYKKNRRIGIFFKSNAHKQLYSRICKGGDKQKTWKCRSSLIRHFHVKGLL